MAARIQSELLTRLRVFAAWAGGAAAGPFFRDRGIGPCRGSGKAEFTPRVDRRNSMRRHLLLTTVAACVSTAAVMAQQPPAPTLDRLTLHHYLNLEKVSDLHVAQGGRQVVYPRQDRRAVANRSALWIVNTDATRHSFLASSSTVRSRCVECRRRMLRFNKEWHGPTRTHSNSYAHPGVPRVLVRRSGRDPWPAPVPAGVPIREVTSCMGT
jgi:hypothetical protein